MRLSYTHQQMSLGTTHSCISMNTAYHIPLFFPIVTRVTNHTVLLPWVVDKGTLRTHPFLWL